MFVSHLPPPDTSKRNCVEGQRQRKCTLISEFHLSKRTTVEIRKTQNITSNFSGLPLLGTRARVHPPRGLCHLGGRRCPSLRSHHPTQAWPGSPSTHLRDASPQNPSALSPRPQIPSPCPLTGPSSAPKRRPQPPLPWLQRRTPRRTYQG